MDRAIEDRLVAMLEAAKGPLPLVEVFSRVDEDFDDEESLAKTLRRMSADGRVKRSERERHGRKEFVYAAGDGRIDAIAAAAQKMQTHPPREEEPTVQTTNDRYIDLLENRGEWMGPKEVAGVLLEHPATAGANLRALAADGRLQTRGAKRGLRYAALGVDDDASNETPATVKPAKGKASKKPERCAAKAARVEQPVADEATKPTLPAVQPGAGKLSWAITDTGVVAINDGGKTIQLSPEDCEYGVSFLEKTQLLWRRAA